MIPITIDGKNLEVPAGVTVLNAAKSAGIQIPTLCNHPALKPYGACRLCVVEVEGARTLQASCTLPVFKAMVVRTDTPRVRKAREFVLMLIFSERNHFCMYCQKSGGDCDLQNAAYGEGMTHWPIQPNWDPQLVDASHPYFVFDHNRCILCRRCVRACSELVGNFTLSLENRGASSHIVADAGIPIGESTCIRCGTCVQICPTGTLIDRKSAYQGKETIVEHVQSVCVGCSVGCGTDLLINNNRLMRVDSLWEAPVNGGVLCELGRYTEANNSNSRISRPMVRKQGALQEVSYDEALEILQSNLKKAEKENGVSALISTRLPAEALYTFREIFKNSKNYTSIEENFTSVNKSIKLYGTLDDVKESDCVVVFGADLVKNHKVVSYFIKRNLIKGTCLIVVDPDENEMESSAHYSLRQKPGTDVEFINGLMAAVVSLGLNKEGSSIQSPTTVLDKASSACGISRDLLVSIGREIACAQKPVFIIGKGMTKETVNDAFLALEKLAKLVHATALINVRGKANSAAAQKFNLDKTFNPSGVSAVYLALGDDIPSERLIAKINNVPFLAVQSSYQSAVTEQADVIIPVENWIEQEGIYMNLDGRVQNANRGVVPDHGVHSNIDVLKDLADRLKVKIGTDWLSELE
jgi:formate dehydrogenase major subunit